jgi:hypothetical protein
LKATAIESVSESYGDSRSSAVAADEMQSFLDDVEDARLTNERTVTDRIRMFTRESKRSILIESRDSDRGSWLHRNYLMK